MTEAKTIWQWRNYKQVTWRHIFVADGWALSRGCQPPSTPTPHPPNPSSHTHTHAHTQKPSKRSFSHFSTYAYWWMDRRMARQTNKQTDEHSLLYSFTFGHYAFAYWWGHQLVNFAHQSCLILIHAQMHIKSMCLLTTISLHLTIRVTFYPLKNALTRNWTNNQRLNWLQSKKRRFDSNT